MTNGSDEAATRLATVDCTVPCPSSWKSQNACVFSPLPCSALFAGALNNSEMYIAALLSEAGVQFTIIGVLAGGMTGRVMVNGSAVFARTCIAGKPARSPATLNKTESPGVNGIPDVCRDEYVWSP